MTKGFLCIDSMHFQSERQKAEEGSPRVWNQAGNELAVLNGLPVCECEFSFKSIRMLSFCQIYKSQNYIIYSFGQYDMHFKVFLRSHADSVYFTLLPVPDTLF
jgi:hypothetical protein